MTGYAPDPVSAATDTRAGTVTLTTHTVASLHELLVMCEEFLRIADSTVLTALRRYLDIQDPPADPFWLIDVLGFHALHLNHQLRTPSLIASAPSLATAAPARTGDHTGDHTGAHTGDGIYSQEEWS